MRINSLAVQTYSSCEINWQNKVFTKEIESLLEEATSRTVVSVSGASKGVFGEHTLAAAVVVGLGIAGRPLGFQSNGSEGRSYGSIDTRVLMRMSHKSRDLFSSASSAFGQKSQKRSRDSSNTLEDEEEAKETTRRGRVTLLASSMARRAEEAKEMHPYL